MPKYSKAFLDQARRSINVYANIIDKISKKDITEFTAREQLHIMTACHDNMKDLMKLLEQEGEEND
ncbi:MAG: hypothetical protein J6S67_11380 [Methanobrevibacter sp.]|nr:hypothetical protein [Methanobrevibacter sp.]